MKISTQETIDKTQDVELTYLPDWNQGKPFVVTGDYDSVVPFAEGLQAADKADRAAQTIVKRMTSPLHLSLGRITVEVR